MRHPFALLAVVAVAACGGEPQPPPADTTGTLYAGVDFTLREPGHAPPETTAANWPDEAGMRFQLFIPDSFAFAQAVVSRLQMPPGRSPKAWIDSVWAAGTIPEGDPDAWSNWDRPKRVDGLASEAWQLVPHCGDCETRQVFLFSGRRVAVLSFNTGTPSYEGREPARKEFQQMLTTFRWVR